MIIFSLCCRVLRTPNLYIHLNLPCKNQPLFYESAGISKSLVAWRPLLFGGSQLIVRAYIGSKKCFVKKAPYKKAGNQKPISLDQPAGALCETASMFKRKKTDMLDAQQGGPLLVSNGVITPINSLTNGVTGVITSINGVIQLRIIGRGPPGSIGMFFERSCL